jgi:tetratricopeptide (TPR) repeat protein
MTEFTVDQALQKAIEAHKTGQLQEADRLYVAILKAQPKHPDANHNMGVLAVGVGKVEQALPFFKTALEANPATVQFWLSYIDTLIKLDKLADAKAVLYQAKSKGAKGDGFDKLEQQLIEAGRDFLEEIKRPERVAPGQPNISKSLKLDQLIRLAKEKAKKGEPEEAKRIYKDILTKFPKNKRAVDGFKALVGGLAQNAPKVQDPTQEQLQTFINLYNQGQLLQALREAENLIQIFPKSAFLFNIQGALLKDLGQLDQSIKAYNQALTIKPDYAQAKFNLAETLKIYSPQNDCGNPLIVLNNSIMAMHDKCVLPMDDQELATHTANLLNEIKSVDKNLSTKSSQIYRRNNIDLNCKRHLKIFNKKQIIPKFCFGCYKVQVDVMTVLDLIRLAALFYGLEFESNLNRKCMIEVRPNIPGFYKGLIYCRGVDQAVSVKKQLDVHVRHINEKLVSKIKKGCSEFSLAYPAYGEVASHEEEMMQYPEEWQAVETEFDERNPSTPIIDKIPSLKKFCLSDYLIIQKWIDYSKGIGDPTSQLFCDLPVQYDEIMDVGRTRVKQ